MPISSRHWGIRSSGRSIATPRASSTSALPQRLEIERLPCLATRTPAAAATSAAAVETLNVPRPSPPVPQVSSKGSRCEMLSTSTPAAQQCFRGVGAHDLRKSHKFIRLLALVAQRGEECHDLFIRHRTRE